MVFSSHTRNGGPDSPDWEEPHALKSFKVVHCLYASRRARVVRVFLSFPTLIWILVPCLVIGSMSVSSDAHAQDESAASSSAPEAPKAEAGSGIKVTLDRKGFRAKTEDGQFKFKMGGRLHADGTYHLGDQPGNVLVGTPRRRPTSTRPMAPKSAGPV